MKHKLITAQSKLTQLTKTLTKSIHDIDLTQWDTSETLIQALESSQWLLGEWVDTHSIKKAYSLGRLLATNPRVAMIVAPTISQNRSLTETEIDSFLANDHDYFIESCLIDEKSMLSQAQITLSEITEVYRELMRQLSQITSFNENLSQAQQHRESTILSYPDIKKDIESIIDSTTKIKAKLILNKKKDYQLHQALLKRCKATLLQIEKDSAQCISTCINFLDRETSKAQNESSELKKLEAIINQGLIIQPHLMPSISNPDALHAWTTNLSGCETSPWNYEKIEWHIKKLRLLRMLETDAAAQLKQPKTLNDGSVSNLEDLFYRYYEELFNHAGHEYLYITQNDINILANASPEHWKQGRQIGCHAIHLVAMCGSPAPHHKTNYCTLIGHLFSKYKQALITLPVSTTIPSCYPRSWSTINFLLLSFIINHKSEHSNDNLEQQYQGLTSLLNIIKMNISYKQFIELIGTNDYTKMISQREPAQYKPAQYNVIRQLLDYASGCLCAFNNALTLLDHNQVTPKNYKVYIPPGSFYTELPTLLFATEFDQSNLKAALVEARVKTRRMTRSINFEMANSSRVTLLESNPQSPSPTSVANIRTITNAENSIPSTSGTPTPIVVPPKKRPYHDYLMWSKASSSSTNSQQTGPNKKSKLNNVHNLTIQTHSL
jgi:hypothetical protein